jgi:hypothetical protein
LRGDRDVRITTRLVRYPGDLSIRRAARPIRCRGFR